MANQPTYKVGDIVMIYENFVTKERPQGKARLIKYNFSNVDAEHWNVRFLGDEKKVDDPDYVGLTIDDIETYERFILIKES